jgi:hypothetical protein
VWHFVEQLTPVHKGASFSIRILKDVGYEHVGRKSAFNHVRVGGGGARGEGVARAAPHDAHVEARLGGREEELDGADDLQNGRDGSVRAAIWSTEAGYGGGCGGGGGGGGREEPRWGRPGGER